MYLKGQILADMDWLRNQSPCVGPYNQLQLNLLLVPSSDKITVVSFQGISNTVHDSLTVVLSPIMCLPYPSKLPWIEIESQKLITLFLHPRSSPQ